MADTGSLGVRAELGKVLESEHADLLREGVALILREVMEMEVSRLAGAEHYARTDDRRAYRNGYRTRRLDTRVGTLELEIPKLRSGSSYMPSFLEARKRSEQALLSVVMEAYVNGVSTRKVERLVEQMGVDGISKSTVSRICQGLDERAEAFRARPLEGTYPYVWFDARIERVRDQAAHTVRHKALLVAYGVHETGRREVIGIDVGDVESEATWREFLRGLVARGLVGVQLVISDAHPGLKNAIATVIGAQWQRCAVHFVRDMLGHVPRQSHPLVRGALKQVFAAVDRDMAGQVAAGVITQLETVAPKVARLLEAAEDDLLAYMRFPREHWPKIRSTNPLERVNREIARRSDVVGIYPNDAALVRLAAGLLVEVNDEWLVQHRYISHASMQLILPHEPDTPPRARRRRPASLARGAGRRRYLHHMTQCDAVGASTARSTTLCPSCGQVPSCGRRCLLGRPAWLDRSVAAPRLRCARRPTRATPTRRRHGHGDPRHRRAQAHPHRRGDRRAGPPAGGQDDHGDH